MGIRGEATGRVVADPTDKTISDKFSVFEFPLYSDKRVKNRDSGEWESDPKGTSKIRVELKFDLRDAFKDVIKKGDIVKVTGTFGEREYDKKDGTKGRSLEAEYVESVEVISSSADRPTPAEVETPW